MRISSRKVLGAGALFVAAAAVAVTYGPFSVASAGANYANTTLSDDSGNEYEAAQRLANLYLSAPLADAATRRKALKSGLMRVVYYDGQIADFRIRRWPSTVPVDFYKTVSSANDSDFDGSSARENYCTTHSTSINTGYWGSSAYLDSNSNWQIWGGWISTGTVTISSKINCL